MGNDRVLGVDDSDVVRMEFHFDGIILRFQAAAVAHRNDIVWRDIGNVMYREVSHVERRYSHFDNQVIIQRRLIFFVFHSVFNVFF